MDGADAVAMAAAMSECSKPERAGLSSGESRAEDSAQDLVDRFATVMEVNGGTVTVLTEQFVAAGVAQLVRGEGTVLVDSGLPGLAMELRRLGVEAGEVAGGEVTGFKSAVSLGDVLPAAGAVVTGAIAGIAETGTVLLGPGRGSEGLLAALAPHHVVVLRAQAIEGRFAKALAKVAPLVATPGNRLVFVSGPSRTADIELITVMGAHGPLRLDVVVVLGGGEV